MLLGLLTLAFAAFFFVSAFLFPLIGVSGLAYAWLAANVFIVMVGVLITLKNGG
jgi:hypothetical protein